MKKGFVLLLISIFTLGLAGCSFFEWTTTTRVTVPIKTSTTDSTTTGTISVDLDLLISGLYDRIYADLYDDIREQVVADLSEQRFQEIYDQVISDILTRIESGEIQVSADSLVDLIRITVLTKTQPVIGVSNLDAEGNVQSIGSGIIYKYEADLNKYYVVTNEHVVEDGHSFAIRFADESTIVATLRGVDKLVDLAVLTFTSTLVLPVATWGDSDAVTKGTVVLACGNPEGYDYFNSVSMGIVSGLDRYFDNDGDSIKDMFVDYIQHDAAINSGNSGGALLNLDGEVIGINVLKLAAVETESMGFAIPSNLASRICADIEVYGVSKQKPVLGVTFLDIATTSDSVFDYYGYVVPVGVTAGFYIISVKVASSMVGILQQGDILLQVGDVVISNTNQFVLGFGKYRVGDFVDIVYLRAGVTYTVEDVELKASTLE